MARKTISSLEKEIERLRKQVFDLQNNIHNKNKDFERLTSVRPFDLELVNEIIDNNKLSQRVEYTGIYRDISYSIVKWKVYTKPEDISTIDRSFSWFPEWNSNGYIYIRPDQVNTFYREQIFLTASSYYKDNPKCPIYDYNNLSFGEMNGGCTWYSIEPNGIAKIGWDYNHSWDWEMRREPDIRHINYDCHRSIDALLEKYPNLLRESYKTEGAD